jgi:plasmid stabilization system protein ParE
VNGYVLSADAALDLDDIWEYIAADSIDAAAFPRILVS